MMIDRRAVGNCRICSIGLLRGTIYGEKNGTVASGLRKRGEKRGLLCFAALVAQQKEC